MLSSLTTLDPLERERRIYDLTLQDTKANVAEWAARAASFASQSPVGRKVVLAQLLAAANFSPEDVWQPVLVLSGTGDRLVSQSCSVDLAIAQSIRQSAPAIMESWEITVDDDDGVAIDFALMGGGFTPGVVTELSLIVLAGPDSASDSLLLDRPRIVRGE